MSREMLGRLARRAAVVVGTIAVIGVAVGTVQVAADWRAASAPLDAAPVSLSAIDDAATVEQERAGDLANQLDGVATQVSTLQAALITANGSVTDDSAHAKGLQDQLTAAKAKLTRLQKQLKAAQGRLQALNQAAARQAAINRANRNRSNSSSGSAATPPPHEGGGDDHD